MNNARASQANTQEYNDILTVIEHPHSWFTLRLSEIWQYRELLAFFIWRDIKVRYKQTVLGATWAVIQPLFSMVIFSIVFGKLAKVSSGDVPYQLFSFAALLPWQLFSKALSDAANSLISSQNMISKVYFPRVILPFSSILGGLVDFGIAFLVFLMMMGFYKTPITWNILYLPLLIFLALLTAFAAGLWISALNVTYRDFRYVTPFLIQFWLYATPIAYPSSLIPKEWLVLYNLNPLVIVVEGFRWALLGQPVQGGYLAILSAVMVFVLFISGFIFFQRRELSFADIV